LYGRRLGEFSRKEIVSPRNTLTGRVRGSQTSWNKKGGGSFLAYFTAWLEGGGRRRARRGGERRVLG